MVQHGAYYLILLPISASDNSLGHRMEGRRSNEVSSAEAVLVGALSSGVNVRTFLLSFDGIIRAAYSIFSVFIVGSTLVMPVFSAM